MAIIDNLLAYYKFDGNGDATDSGPNSLNLTNNNSTAYATGKIRTGADLEQSSNNYFNNSSSSFDLTSSFSFSCWIKPETIALGYSPSVLSKDSASQGYNLRINYTNSKLEWLKHDGVTVLSSTSTLSTATWYLINITFDGTNLKMYINGSLEATTAYTSHTASGSNFRVGNSTQYSTRYFDGIIDELGVWTRDLNSTEITSLYNSGAGLSAPFGTGISISNAKTATAGGGNATVTITGFTVEGDDNCVVASVCNQNNGGSTSGVTCNGVAMTLVDTQAITGSNGVTLWALYGATTGNIVATRTGGTSDRITVCAVNHTGVKSTTAIASLPKAKATGSGNIAAALTTTVDNSWVTMGTYVSAGGDVSSAGSNTTKRVVEPEIGDHWDSGSAVTPAGSRTLNVTNSGTPAYSYVMMALEPKTASSTSQIKTWNGVANT